MIKTIKRPLSKIKHYLDTYMLPNLEVSQYWSLDEQVNYQSDRLTSIYRHHFKNTLIYRKLCQKEGLNEYSIKGIEDIKKLPIVERCWFQNNSKVRNVRYQYGALMHTGGSTGELLEYMGCNRYHRLREQAHARGWSYFGLTNEKEFFIIASQQARLATAKDLSGELNSDNIKEVVKALDSNTAKFVRGYASSCYIIAMFMLQHGQQNTKVRAFNLVSENVYEWQREAIKIAFPISEVYEEYVCNDGGASAWECSQHDGLHEAIERAIIETDTNDEIIVTDLWNRTMPFIRYRNGDLLVQRKLEACKCGRTLPKIKVRGRTNDILVTPYGPVSPTYLMMWGSGYNYTGTIHNKGFTQIQYVQSPGYKLTINLVKNEFYTKTDLDRLREQVERICQGMEIEYCFLNQIEISQSGKRRFIINNDKELLKDWLFDKSLKT